MKKLQGKKKILGQTIHYVYILLLFAACAPYVNTELAVATKVNTPPVPDIQSTPTHESQNTISATTEPELTFSAIPTLAIEQARSKVLELLATNSGCRLPCFWGIAPGKTKWSEVREFLRSISSQYSDGSTETNSEFFYSDMYLPANDIQGPSDLKLELGVHRDTIRTISVSDFDAPNYYLGEFLLENGEPDEIWIFTNSRGPINSPDKVGFLVSLFYRDKQMIAAFGRGSATINDVWINGCVQYSPALKIWALEKPLSFPEATNFFYGNNVIAEGWKEISEATQGEFDINSFYQTFADPSVQPCLKTPKSLWPEL